MKDDAGPAPRTVNWKAAIYRQSRLWHGYLSAFAFLSLMFFSATGLILNHPEWLEGAGEQTSKDFTLQLAPQDIAMAQKAGDPARALGEAVGEKTRLVGGFQSGELIDGQAMLRFEGPKGSSDVAVDLESGETEVTVTRARMIDMLNELHRGKNAGAAWKAVIDVTAILVLALSIIGYVLFFTLRFRLRTSLILTAASLAFMVGVVVWLTP